MDTIKTSLPWKRDVMCGSITQYPIVVSQQGVICEIVGPGNTMEEATASADFIVRACNNHDIILNTLKHVSGKISAGALRTVLHGGEVGVYLSQQEIEVIRAVISEAEVK